VTYSTRKLLIAFALAKLVLHLASSPGYGYFRDELYYIACSAHLDWGYVDHPALSVIALAWSRLILGDSLVAIRLLPAVAGALTILFVGLMARELGGDLYAQVLAMTAALIAPEYLSVNRVYSMNGFDVLFWTLSAYLLIRILKEENSRLWIVLGLVLGLGLENKISVLWLGAGLAVGLLVTSAREWLATPWPWISGFIAVLLFVPYVVWQINHGWPTLEFIEVATTEKMAPVHPLDYLIGQIEMMHPFNLPIWLSGLYFLLVSKHGARYRLLGWIYLTVLGILLAAGSARIGYLVPTYTWLLASGAVLLSGLFRRQALGWLKTAGPVALVMGGIATAPFALPILPVESYIGYARALGVQPSTEERKEVAALPQHYADMHGWNVIVNAVSEVYSNLPKEEQGRVAVLAPNYGVAGAIDFFGSDFGLPRAISSHNNYWLWGPGDADGRVMIVIGWSEEAMARRFESYGRVATIECGYCMPYENNNPVWVGRGLRVPMNEFWDAIKNFN
jgi:hypothetical protein